MDDHIPDTSGSGSAAGTPLKRKANSQFYPNKKMRCGRNSYLVVGNRYDPLNLESDELDPSEPEVWLTPSRLNPEDPLNLNSPPRPPKKKKRRQNDEDLFTPVFVSQRRFSIVQKKIKQSHLHHVQHGAANTTSEETIDEIRRKKGVTNSFRYRFGNFNKYYGNRPQLAIFDQRLNFLCSDMFEGKDVLDIGCNSGLLTISIAKVFQPSNIVGLDIDGHLIRAAQQNIRYFCDRDMKFMHRFPTSFPHCFGPITSSPVGHASEFPYNIKFMADNYVLENDDDLEKVVPEYDVVLLFSTTKWIHLNFGDSGLIRVFRRIYRQLRPNGKLFLECTPFEKYKRSANSCPILRSNYNDIRLMPDQFTTFLLSQIGFRHCEDVGIAMAGFSGPLMILFKEELIRHEVSLEHRNSGFDHAAVALDVYGDTRQQKEKG